MALQNVIVAIFYETFVSFWNQRCFNEIEELKILRKLWVGSVHQALLARMREAVAAATNCDIETNFKSEAIASIKSFYQNRLRLSPQQVAALLPLEGKMDREACKRTESVSYTHLTLPTTPYV